MNRTKQIFRVNKKSVARRTALPEDLLNSSATLSFRRLGNPSHLQIITGTAVAVANFSIELDDDIRLRVIDKESTPEQVEERAPSYNIVDLSWPIFIEAIFNKKS